MQKSSTTAYNEKNRVKQLHFSFNHTKRKMLFQIVAHAIKSYKQKTCIVLFGITDDNNYITLNVHGFKKVFYVKKSHLKTTKVYQHDFEYLSISEVKCIDFYGYNQLEEYLKFEIDNHLKKKEVFDYLETCLYPTIVNLQTYEYGLDISLEFNRQINYSPWVEINYYTNQNDEYDCEIHNICPKQVDKISNFKILSFDIECITKDNTRKFPDASLDDPIIMIGCYFGSGDCFNKSIYLFRKCDQIEGAKVIVAKNEIEMISMFVDFIKTFDPDIITGYNISGFDFPFLIQRIKKLKIESKLIMGRTKKYIYDKSERMSGDNTFGLNDRIKIEGRIVLDMFLYVKTCKQLSDYKLNNVAFAILNEKKDDVGYDQIKPLYFACNPERAILSKYCIQDAVLPILLMKKLKVVINTFSLSKTCKVGFDYIINRKSQVRVMSMLLNELSTTDFIIPDVICNMSMDYEGAHVITPKAGLYESIIVTLDYASLYPSIMIANNLCYSTLFKSNTLEKDAIKSPLKNVYFKSPSIREGILPKILKNCIQARKDVRREMKGCTDPFQLELMNGMQLAFKLCANSLYGFTGASTGSLPCTDISESVTKIGKTMILKSKDYVESLGKGYDVIYGDTDSIMINVGDVGLENGIQIGLELATKVTTLFQEPCKMEFEKIFYPMLLLAKKKYAGLLWTRADKYDKMDVKGLEPVRSDISPLQKNLSNMLLNHILITKNTSEMKKYIKNLVESIGLYQDIDLYLLQNSKELKREVEDYTNEQLHSSLVKRLKKENRPSIPKVGDRVAYIVTTKADSPKICQRTEDPIYVLDNNIEIDKQYYIDQTKSIVDRICKFSLTPLEISEIYESIYTSCDQRLVNGKRKIEKTLIKQDRVVDVEELEKLVLNDYETCKICQAENFLKIKCVNNNCSIYFKRKQNLKTLNKYKQVTIRFD